MSAPNPSTEEVIKRLEILHHKLEDEGLYVRANTVWLAIEEIKRLDGENCRDSHAMDIIRRAAARIEETDHDQH